MIVLYHNIRGAFAAAIDKHGQAHTLLFLNEEDAERVRDLHYPGYLIVDFPLPESAEERRELATVRRALYLGERDGGVDFRPL
jgi:hypothetical protein